MIGLSALHRRSVETGRSRHGNAIQGQVLHMRFRFDIFSGQNSRKWRIRLAGNPLALVLLLAVLLWLALFVRSAVKFTWDHYSPYEGTVVEIKRDWTDHLTSESGDTERLIIRTPQGRLIHKCISFETRVMNNIHKGDYVTKERGFTGRIQRRDKDL